MAVRAQYPPNVLLLNRNEQELKEMDYSPAPPPPPPSQGFFFPNGKSKKRVREPQSEILSNEELAAQITEIDQLLVAQGEKLRAALAERWQRQHRALLAAAAESAARVFRAKEAEVELEARRRAELEHHLARLRADSMAWQAKAAADQATAAALHAQLQREAAAAAAAVPGESPPRAAAEDAESAYVDPHRPEPRRKCRTCGVRPAEVVVLPCRHLCLCAACGSSAAAAACPVCLAVSTGSVEVFLC